jgi:uncharacterized RmlC-like cupin family protein
MVGTGTLEVRPMIEIPSGTEVRVIRAGQDSDRTAQTAGMARRSGVDATSTGATRLWMGRVTGPPGMRSAPHTHGEAETGAYVLSGHCRIYYGEEFKEYVDAGPGDLLFVPANTPHIEANLSEDEPAEFVVTRSPSNIVINLE